MQDLKGYVVKKACTEKSASGEVAGLADIFQLGEYWEKRREQKALDPDDAEGVSSKTLSKTHNKAIMFEHLKEARKV